MSPASNLTREERQREGDSTQKAHFEEACLGCKELDLKKAQGYKTSLATVQHTASGGCESCKLLLRLLLPRYEENLKLSNGKFNLVANWVPFFRLGITFDSWYEITDRIELFTQTGEKTPWPSIRTSQHVDGDTSSNEHLRQAQVWLQHCLQHHQHCSPSRSTEESLPRLPKRVIDVTPLDHDGSIRLKESDGERGEYACLSHCWGDVRPYSTIKSNLARHKTKIAWADLPKSFQDAVDFVRRLGKKYLWVDSLCILQDDHSDWELHARQMADIYRQSYLTLAGTAAKDSTCGLYQKNPSYMSRLVPSNGSGHQPSRIYTRQSIAHWYESIPDPLFVWYWSFTPTKSHFPLLDRAWVFQERLLSPRTLHFGPAELIWECCETFTCECLTGITAYSEQYPKIQHHRELNEGTYGNRRLLWQKIVREFARLSITYPSDRFPALLGIGSQLLEGSQYKIISGLWSANMLQELLWFAGECHESFPRGTGPTWSWTYIGQRGWPSWPINVLAAKEYAYYDGFGAPADTPDDQVIIAATTVTLSASLVKGRLFYDEPDSGKEQDATSIFVKTVKFLPDGSWPDDSDKSPLKVLPDRPWFCRGPDNIANGALACCAFIATFRRAAKSEEWDQDYALIIQPVDQTAKRFRRVGILTSRAPTDYVPSELVGAPPMRIVHTESLERTTFTLV